jgi:hypothetical protein
LQLLEGYDHLEFDIFQVFWNMAVHQLVNSCGHLIVVKMMKSEGGGMLPV